MALPNERWGKLMIINVTYKMTFAKKIDEKPAYGK